jgi:cell division protein FtsQ
MWLIYGGGLNWLTRELSFSLVSLPHRFGLQINSLLVEGRRYTSADVIQKAILPQKNSLIFQVDPIAIKKRLEDLPWVRSAVVQRQWPSSLYVRLIEQYPIAIWQQSGTFHLIDEHGTLLEEQNVKSFAHLPVLTGEKAPQAAPALLEALAQFPDLMKHVTGATFVGGRRWDLIIKDKLTVKLPEERIREELQYLSHLLQAGEIEEKGILSIDLRTPDRAYFYLSDEAAKRQFSQPSKSKHD